MTRRAVSKLLALLALAVATPARADRVLADRIVAVVEPSDPSEPARIVVSSALEALARIRLVERRGSDLLWASLTTDFRAAVLEELVNELLIYDEAARLGLDRVSESALDEDRDALVARFGGEPRLVELFDAYDLGESDLVEILTRRRVVREFLAANVAQSVTSTDPNAAAASLRDAVERWVRALRERSRVRVLPG